MFRNINARVPFVLLFSFLADGHSRSARLAAPADARRPPVGGSDWAAAARAAGRRARPAPMFPPGMVFEKFNLEQVRRNFLKKLELEKSVLTPS